MFGKKKNKIVEQPDSSDLVETLEAGVIAKEAIKNEINQKAEPQAEPVHVGQSEFNLLNGLENIRAAIDRNTMELEIVSTEIQNLTKAIEKSNQ